MKRLCKISLFPAAMGLAALFACSPLAHAGPLTASAPASPSSVLPQFAFGGGWYSALYFTNCTATPASFTVSFIGDTGAPLTVPSLNGSSTQVKLAAYGTAVIEAPNVGSLVQGYAAFTLPAGVFGYGVFRQSVPGQLDQEAVVPLSDATAISNTLIWDETNLITAVAIVNPSATANTVQVTLWDENGNTIGTSSVALPAYNKTALTLRSLPGLGGMVGKRGSAQFSVSSGNVAVLGLRFDELAFTSIPTATVAAAALSRPSVLPQFAFGGGWYSALYFTNMTGSPASFSVNFTSDAGTPLTVPSVGGSTTQVNLPANGSAVIEAPNEGSLVQGYVTFTLPPGVFGYGVFRQSVPGQLDQEAVAPLSSVQGASTTLTWDETNLITAVAMVNPSSTAATGTVTLLDENGNKVGTSPISLPANAKTAAALSSLPGLAGMVGKRGSAQFSVTAGNIAVLGLRFDQLAFTSIPTTGPQPSTSVSAIAERALTQAGLGVGLASTVLESQLQILLAILEEKGSCTTLPGGGSVGTDYTFTTATVYYDSFCTHPYIVANPITTTTGNNAITITETATYHGANGAVIGSLPLQETAVIATDSETVHGTGLFTPAGGSQTPVQLGLYCTFNPSMQEPCGGGVVQDFPDLGIAIGVVPTLTLDMSGQSLNSPVTFTGGGSPVTGPLGSLTLTNPQPTSLGIQGGTIFSSLGITGGAAGLDLFPPTPTGWTVTDSEHDEQLQIAVVQGETSRSLTLTITRVSTGETLATGVLDQSGSGTIAYSDGTTPAITNWTLAD
jgi:hypothetical protein